MTAAGRIAGVADKGLVGADQLRSGIFQQFSQVVGKGRMPKKIGRRRRSSVKSNYKLLFSPGVFGMSDWYIQKSGFSSDSVLGPLTSEQVIALFNRGEIKKKTPIASQQHTGNEWMIFGKTVLWKQAQEADQLQKQKKEQAAAELKKQQEQEEIQIQQQVVVADRQPPVVAQPLPTAVQVASTVPPSNQQFTAGQSASDSKPPTRSLTSSTGNLRNMSRH